MTVVVQKYGGTSLETVEHVRRAAQRVARAHRAGQQVVVVVSARGDTTDDLIRLARQVSPTQPPRELDQLLATGECVSAALLASALDGIGTPAVSLTGAQAGVRATGRHCSGVIEAIDVARVRRLLDEGKAVVVAGFQGINTHGDVVTLGRGGSDTTAVAFAAALGASHCEIYTDVDGVYTADPRIVPTARALPMVDVQVMAEMAFAGARVLHPRSVELAATQEVELHVRGSLSASPGSVVRPSGRREIMENRGTVIAVTHDLNLARVLLRAPRGGADLAAEVLALLARHDVAVDLVARSGTYEEFRMGFTLARDEFDDCEPALSRLLGRSRGAIDVDLDVGKLSFVGMGLLNRPEHTARALSALTGAGIDTSWLSTSQQRISAVVPRDRLTRATSVLHDEFRLAERDQLAA